MYDIGVVVAGLDSTRLNWPDRPAPTRLNPLFSFLFLFYYIIRVMERNVPLNPKEPWVKQTRPGNTGKKVREKKVRSKGVRRKGVAWSL